MGLRAVQKLNRVGKQWGKEQYSQEHDLASEDKVSMDWPFTDTSFPHPIHVLHRPALLQEFELLSPQKA